MSTLKRVARNYLFNVSSSTFESITDLAILAILARHLDTTNFGNYAFVMAFVAFFRMLFGLGIPVIVVREVAKSREKAGIILGNALLLQGSVAIVAVALVVTVTIFITNDSQIRWATILTVTGTFFWFLGNLFIAITRAFEKMGYSAARVIIAQSIYLIGIGSAAFLGFEFIFVFWIFLAARFSGLLFSTIIVCTKFVKPVISFDSKICKRIFMEAYPVGIRRMIRQASLRIDTMMLAFLRTSSEVGLFHGIYKLSQGFMFIGESIMQAVFPVIARSHANSQDQLNRIYEDTLKAMLIVGQIFGISFIFLSHHFIKIVLGDKFLPAASSLQIFSGIVVLMFLAKLYERFMIAANRQMASTIIAAVAFMVNLTLDLVLIPHWGIVGATIATLTAEIVLFITAYAYCHRHIATQSVVSIYASAFGSALLACLMVGVLNTYFNIQIIIALFLGYICYLGSLLFFNFFTRLDLLILKELVNFR